MHLPASAISFRGALVGALVLLIVVPPAETAAQEGDVAAARRVADVASTALAEYGDGVLDGVVVQRAEWEEAGSFLEQALALAADLSEGGRAVAVPPLRVLQLGVHELRPEHELRVVLAGLREQLAIAVGAPLDPVLRGPPSLDRGETLYVRHCAACHGDAGRGDGPAAGALVPPPADLTDAERLRGTAPVDFFRKINVGVAGTAMPGFAEQLSADDRWMVALYTASLRHPTAQQVRGEGLLSQVCPECLLLVSDFNATAGMSDDSLSAALASGSGGGMTDSVRSSVEAFARVAGAREWLGADRGLAARRVAALSAAGAARAVEVALAGDRDRAQREVLDAYLAFEKIESGVRARDAHAATAVEGAFRGLREAIASGRDSGRLVEAREHVNGALTAATAVLRRRTAPAVLFGQSLVIMLREGFEAILIVGALVTFLIKAGAEDRRRDIGYGVLAAVGASLLTALAFATVFREAARHQELLEGITMLTAAAVLFWVSYWLVSKIEVRKWREFVQGQMRRALGSKRVWALSSVAFLAVYREGFETVLFYAALFTETNGVAGQVSAVVAGITVGIIGLVLVYVAIERFGLRIPLKAFFAATSAFLYVMAFAFAGQGVAELQAAGTVSTTPMGWLPAVPALGIFPTFQTFCTQLAVALALGGALAWVFWLEPRRVAMRSDAG
jgi:high-affinity iron transporter